jgi:hypothetical protein
MASNSPLRTFFIPHQSIGSHISIGSTVTSSRYLFANKTEPSCGGSVASSISFPIWTLLSLPSTTDTQEYWAFGCYYKYLSTNVMATGSE